MPPKKKTGLKLKKKIKKPKEYLPNVNNVPVYQDPEDIYPKADILITYAHMVNKLFGKD